MFLHFFPLFLILLYLCSSLCDVKTSDNYKKYLKKIGNYEIVYPKVLNPSELHYRWRRSSEKNLKSPKNRFRAEIVHFYISLKNLTIKARKNEDVIVSEDFSPQWMNSGGERESINSGPALQKCFAIEGSVREVAGSAVVLTLCENEIFGLLTLYGRAYFIQPINEHQHAMYETKIPESVEAVTKNADFNLDIDNEIEAFDEDEKFKEPAENAERIESIPVEPSLCPNSSESTRRERQEKKGAKSADGKVAYRLSSGCGVERRKKRALTICDTRERYYLKKDVAKMDYLDMIDPTTNIKPMNFEDRKNSVFRYGPSYSPPEDQNRPHYNRNKSDRPPRQLRLSTRWIKIAIGVDHDVIKFHGARTQQYVFTIMNIVSTLFKQISTTFSTKIVVMRMHLYTNPKDSAIYGRDPKYPLYSVNRWNRALWKEATEKHDMAIWMTHFELSEDVNTVPGAFMCQYQWSCLLVEDAGWLSAIKIAHGIGHLIGLTHDGDLDYHNNCASEALLQTTIMSDVIPAVMPTPVWSSCSKREFQWSILRYHCLEKPPTNFQHSAFMSGVFSLDDQCRIEFGEGWIFCSRIHMPDPCRELWCNKAVGSRRSCMTRQTPTLEGTACGRGKRCINHTCEDAKRPVVEAVSVTLDEETRLPEPLPPEATVAPEMEKPARSSSVDVITTTQTVVTESGVFDEILSDVKE